MVAGGGAAADRAGCRTRVAAAADGGPSLAQQFTGAELARATAGVLTRFGALQRDLAPAVGELLAAGVPDMRPERMPDRFDQAVTAAAGWVRDQPDRDLLDRVVALRAEFRNWCEVLGADPLPASVDHNDLHPGNVLGRAFLDWGDAGISHPFAVALVPLRVIAELLPSGTGSPDWARARRDYLAGFAGAGDPDGLVSTLELAGRVARVARLLTWERALRTATRSGEPIEERWRSGAWFWLRELASHRLWG